jgi:hypothetical protein
MHIYVLKLTNDKYYIGETDNIEKTYENHFMGYENTWTKKYKPICVIELIKKKCYMKLNNYVIDYMYYYGVDNVSGGDYIDLDELQIKLLQKYVWNKNKKCTRCGKNNHLVCKEFTDIYNKKIVDNSDSESYESTSDSDID